jgi:hypothetical protein
MYRHCTQDNGGDACAEHNGPMDTHIKVMPEVGGRHANEP